MKSSTTRFSRRTLLVGAGVSMGLPWLESLNVWGDEAPSGPKRFAALFMGNGISPAAGGRKRLRKAPAR